MKQLSILLVEDERVVAFDVTHRLQLLGYPSPVVVPSGEEALKIARDIKPDLILMDIMLEGEMDGIDTAIKLREQYDAPIIYLTALVDPALLQRAKITGPFGYVVKPFDDRELHICIEMALYKHAAEREQAERELLFSTTLHSIREAVIITDTEGRITFCNPAAQRLLRHPASDLENAQIETVASLTLDDESQAIIPKELLKRHAATSQSLLAGSIQCGEGRCPVEVSASALHNKTRNIGTVLVLRDLTRRRADEASLAKALGEMQQLFEQTVTALAATSEKRDPYTAGHQQRVASLACAIAERIGVDSDDCHGLRMAGLLHDIGKIYIPSEMLTKPSTLSEIEKTIMKTHSQVGYDILKGVDFPWPVAQMVLQHHERMDGSGYPQGLHGDQIILGARILAVADVVEAMYSHRPYRPAVGLDAALQEIEKGSETHYWPPAVNACLELFAQGFEFEAASKAPAGSDGEHTS
ncbi:HD domain-containing phosphohydrolase [Oleidesulfovibrio sp.]|uniref:HD domain-containing phosphohydrolase n=1 Tax=Oleidesulfovibrio sp. TaxID=2909707 RepID=UPI003A853378